jgi:hypothetical protein
MQRRGQGTEISLTTIFGAVIAITFVLFVFTQCLPAIAETYESEEQGDEYKQLYTALQQDTQETVTLTVPENTGYFAFAPTGDWEYREPRFSPERAEEFRHIQGFYKYRPDTCPNATSCLCKCEGLQLEDFSPERYNETFGEEINTALPNGLITCQQTMCRTLDTKVAHEHRVSDVFGDKLGVQGYSQRYWFNGFTILDHPTIDPDATINGVPLDVAGYAKHFETELVDVNIQNTPEGKTVCLKSSQERC